MCIRIMDISPYASAFKLQCKLNYWHSMQFSSNRCLFSFVVWNSNKCLYLPQDPSTKQQSGQITNSIIRCNVTPKIDHPSTHQQVNYEHKKYDIESMCKHICAYDVGHMMNIFVEFISNDF